ncbi:MAG TPA: hypothetical protein VGN72_18680 [Tepidisphaeraceae bacterium]|jgi:hypothetical protein|nr:hypothetical protein [Tepidisphaeraceae bacterium]
MTGRDDKEISDLELARKGAARTHESLERHVASLEKEWPALSPAELAEGRKRAQAARDAIQQVLTRLAETPTS